MTLAAILKEKAFGPITIKPEMPISDVINILAERRIGAVLVVNQAGSLVGIVSERDIVRCLASHAAATLQMTAAALMTREPTTAGPEISVATAMEMMTEGRFRHLPIVEQGVLTGLVSIGDVVKARLTQQEHEVDTLRAYVVGAS